MAEYIVGPVLHKLIKSLSDYMQDQFRWQTGMKKELEILQDNYPKIQAVVSNAKRAQTEDQNSALNKWIWHLRDAIDEADDLLDDFEYKKNKKSSIRRNLIKVCERALKIDPNLKRLSKVVQKLNRISVEVSTFRYLLKSVTQEQREQQVELEKTRETGSLPKVDLVGRAKDKKFVIEWLSKPSNKEYQTHGTSTTLYNNISLLSVVGHGGMGKTTLLQHVYQDEIAKEYDLKMWVCVSDKFDVKNVIKDMLECLQKKRPTLESLNELQKSLLSEVMTKKFLLVLDDIWDDKEEEVLLLSKWGDVLAPLANGGLESKILITTRMDIVASMMAKVIGKKKETLRLKGLEEDECLLLLTTHAFSVGQNPDDHGNLKSIARVLVKKLYGSPLLAKVMGGVLNSSLDERHWRTVLNNSLDLNGIIPILKMSYAFLPENLQSCFSFCSIFKQDYVFDKDDLVRMWIAVGFIQPSYNNQGETLTLEDIGERYFEVLIKKSFFEEVFRGNKRYKMHDLLYELAQNVSRQECCRFMGDEKSMLLKIPRTIRHLYVETSNPEVLKKLGRFKNLRTLIICYNQSFVHALNEMFKETRSIHLLHMLHINDNTEPKVIPENIGYLHHIRYLRFTVPFIWLLPISLSSLYHLQFLKIDGLHHNDNSKDYFPRDMNNLSNLRYLSCHRSNFPGIGKLKFLQELYGFQIENENGYRIEELEHMNELCILKILNLKNVRDAEEAYNAKLCDKRKLMELYLFWTHTKERDNPDSDLDERVLDNLQPHKYLKTLQIRDYMGARSAIWMNDAHLIINLQAIYLTDCFDWEILPPFGQLPFLKTLYLDSMPKVKRLENKFHGNDMCCAFPSLERLHLYNLEALVDWFDASIFYGLFPCLTDLWLYNCPNLQELLYLPPKLESLIISNIRWKTLNCSSISKSIPLRKLHFYQCQNITSIFLAGVIGKLKELTIKECPNLISFGEEHQEVEATENRLLILDDLIISDPFVLQIEPLRSSTSIRKLTIENNDELVIFPVEAEQWLLQVSSSLRELQFKNLQSLQSLPSSLASIFSLEILIVDKLPQLRELPALPRSCKNLTISNCDPDLMKHYEQS